LTCITIIGTHVEFLSLLTGKIPTIQLYYSTNKLLDFDNRFGDRKRELVVSSDHLDNCPAGRTATSFHLGSIKAWLLPQGGLMIKKFMTVFCMMMLMGVVATSAFADDAKDKAKKQKKVLEMRDKALASLAKSKPETVAEIKRAAGYAVFDNAGIHLLLFATSRGNGVAVPNSGAPTYMKMRTVGAGPGLGVKDYQVIFVFKDPAAFRKFVEAGWDFGGEADAAAKSKDSGGAASAAGSATSDMKIYTITKKGVALQATLGGTKFSKDDDLN
jgi:lipid-binding SYLF domain-containing protein